MINVLFSGEKKKREVSGTHWDAIRLMTNGNRRV